MSQTLRAIAAVFAFHAFYLAWSHDLGFIEGIRESYELDARPTRKELLERGEAWRPYRTFATWYMWGVRRLSQGIERERTRIVSL